MQTQETRSSPAIAALAASAAFILPLVLSHSTTPSPNHPRVLLWYRSLKKPWFKPKDWVIPLAWFGIEACLARAMFRLIRAAPTADKGRSIGLLSWNIFMIGGWSRLFFGRRHLAMSTVAAASMIATGAAFVVEARKVDKPAARAGIPLVGWLAFATVLTATIWSMNRRR
jgi:benzodiazapine receptor